MSDTLTEMTYPMTADPERYEYLSQILVCPICKSELVHFGRPELIPGCDDYKGRAAVRGDVITIPCMCEDNLHAWLYILGQHKGNTWAWYEVHEVNSDDPWEWLSQVSG